jgi:hypothetical protein
VIDQHSSAAEPQPAPPPAAVAEPATARALWPTFMRRTLPEETLREAARKPEA